MKWIYTWIKLKISVFLFSFFLFPLFIVAQCPDPVHPDYGGLIALYNSTDGPNWTDNTGWVDGAAGTNCDPCDGWFGVNCNTAGRVTCLSLYGNGDCNGTDADGNNLTGTIPSALSELSNLGILDLRRNNLVDSIPGSLGSLSDLVHLNLSGNDITGNIPADLGNLFNLIDLSLGGNQLSGAIPSTLGSLSNLEELSLYNNLLTNIPAEIGNMSSLRLLDVEFNLLTGNLPNTLGSLSNLESIDLSSNNFTGSIPTELGSLSNLRILQLDINDFTGGIPSELGNLSALTTLFLTQNNLSGSIPPELGGLLNLQTLLLSENDLTGTIPLELGNLSNLRRLWLQDNQLEGCYPDEINFLCAFGSAIGNGNGYNLTNNPSLPWNGDMERWCNGEDQFGATCNDGLGNSGTIDINCECETLCNHPDYDALMALYNSTNGPNWTVNTGWVDGAAGTNCDPCSGWFGVSCSSGRVTELSMNSNQLSGIISVELENLSSLEFLYLGLNQLSGSIPSELGNLSSLIDLDLGLNQLSGSIPSELGNLSSLTRLWLNENQLSGIIPSELGNIFNLGSLALFSNQLSGVIPVELGNLSSLTGLWLNNNQLSGIIPSELGNLSSLEVLFLDDNQLSGIIPSELGNLSSLEFLYLDDNQLSGIIPSELGNLSSLEFLFLDDNQLSGSIPSELGNLSSLTRLWLHSNQLSGIIPSELGNLSSLTHFYLQNNQLEGCFPDEINQFCALGFDDTGLSSSSGYNLSNNPGLPWNGDMERWCNGEEQIGALCEDGDPNSFSDVINADCSCAGTIANICRMADSLVLVDLYTATNGAGWTNPWNLNEPMTTWDGVELNGEGCVDKLNLFSRNATGTLPDLPLSAITEFRVIDNPDMTGPIPVLTNWTQIEQINLGGNGFSGNPEFSNMPNLIDLNLSGNDFSGTLPNYNLPALIEIFFSDNNFSGPIPDFTGMPGLEKLHFHTNELTGSIPAFSNLPVLDELSAFNNDLTTIEPQTAFIANGNTFVLVELENNAFTFEDILNANDFLTNSGGLDYTYAPQENIFSPTTYNVVEGDDLSIDLGIDAGINSSEYQWFKDNATNIVENDNTREFINIQLDDAGTYRVEVTNPNAPDLTLVSFDIIINVSNSCRNRDSLALIDLYTATNGASWTNNENWLVPDQPLSTWYGVQTNTEGCVTAIDLDGNPDFTTDTNQGNNLQGELPASLGDFELLEGLFLAVNQLSGNIPTTLGDLSNLSSLDLASNQLEGSIPQTLGQLSQLRFLELDQNQLTGSIPDAIGNLSNLIGLYLYSNSLSGEIPGTITQLNNLEFLVLFDNNLSGSVPDLTPLTNLLECTIQDNELTDLPDLSNMMLGTSSFQGLKVQNNKLTFEDILPTQPLFADNANSTYAPQDSIFAPTTYNLSEGDNLSIDLEIDAGISSSEYEWFKDNVTNIVENDNTRDFLNVQLSDAGTYRAEVTNPNAPDLTLVSFDIIINVTSSCRNRDSLALVALYNATNGASWTNTWDLSQPMETWYGVRINAEGCVTCLDLDGVFACSTSGSGGNNLIGNIPSEIGDLNNLTHLSLGLNDLTGNIPVELDNLANLTHLSLIFNDLTGNIPVELGSLENLTHLALWNNGLTGNIPVELGSLENLTHLDLEFNDLTGNIPVELGSLENLGHLYLGFNELTGNIPVELGNLENLTVFNLRSNELTGTIPPELAQLINLEQFDLQNNQLEGCFPETLSDFCNLGFTDSIYTNGYNLTNNPGLPWNGDMERWCNGEDQFGATCSDDVGNSGTIDINCECETLCNHPDFNALMVLYNSTDGENWTDNTGWVDGAAGTNCDPCNGWFGVTCSGGRVTELGLTSNQLSGIIPSELGNLSSLTRLWLDRNQLSGMIPVELGNISSLTRLDLAFNQLSGSIPSELGNLSSLTDLFLYSNQLSGSIPSELGNLSSLTGLYLGDNQLSGSIPAELGNLSSLTDLYLLSNQLSGSIPAELGNLSNLTQLYLENNQLEGCYPDEINQFCVLGFNNTGLNSDGYNLTNNPGLPWQGDMERWCNGEDQIGAICSDALGNAGTIDANCVCEVPCSHPDYDALMALYNSTDGPNWTDNTGWMGGAAGTNCDPCNGWFGVTCSGGRVTELGLTSNQLSGSIPAELENLSSLTRLWLDRNQLSGMIPVELGNISSLTRLDLAFNQLSGSIPSELGNLSSLTDLFLYSNQLSGSIPSELGNLSSLAGLYLGDNQLSGSIPSELGNLSSLTDLYLLSNQLSGSIPAELGNLSNLTQFYLENNQLEGCYPDEINQFCALGFNNTGLNSDGYNLTNNPGLPWQGDMERWCNGEEQIGATCDDGNDANGTNDLIQIDCSCAAPLPNDLCSGAINLNNNTPESGDLTTATSDPTTGGCTNDDHTVWYSFTTGANQTQITITSNGLDFIEIYLDCDMTSTIFSGCGQGQASSATDLFCVEPNTTYYIQVGSSTANAGPYDITYIENNPGVAEICTLASDLGTVNCGEMMESISNGQGVCVEENSSCVTTGSEWSRITIGAEVTDLILESNSVETDLYVGVDCNSLTLVNGQDGNCAYPLGLTIPVSVGETYWVQQGTGGTIQLEALCCNNTTAAITPDPAAFCADSNITLDAGNGFTSYVWTDGTTSQTFSTSAPGIYTVTVTAPNGCTATDQITVTENMRPTPTITASENPVCPPATGTDLEAEGGFVNYAWSDGITNSQIFTNATATIGGSSYTVTVTDNNGCTGENTITLFLSEVGGTINCPTTINLGAPGSISGAPTGSAPYVESFNLISGTGNGNLINNGDGTATINGTVAGTVQVEYLVADTDCGNPMRADICTITIVDPCPPVFPMIANNGPICQGDPANIIFNLTEGTPPYSIELTDGVNNLSFNNLSDGDLIPVTLSGNTTYELLNLTDNAGCFEVFSGITTTVTVNPLPISNIEVSNDIDCVNQTVSLSSSGSSEGPDISYEWQNSSGGTINAENTITVSSGGSYTLVVLDNTNGCTSSETSIVIENIVTPTADAGPDGSIPCAVVPLGINLDGTGSSAGNNFSYLWTTNGGNFTSNTDIQNPSIDGVGTYTLIVTDNNNGCTAEDQVMFNQEEGPQDVMLNIIAPSCYDDEDGEISILEVEGGEGPFEYSLDNAGFSDNNIFTNLVSGSYDLEIIDANGCIYSTSADLINPLETEIELGEQLQMIAGEEVNLNTIINIDSAEIESIVWSPTEGLSCDDCLTPSVSPSQTTVYTLTITTLRGCMASAELLVEVDTDENLVWELITPYVQDGKNDEWIIPNIDDYPENHVTIFNRWGDVILEARPYSNNDPWGGENKHGKLVPQGTYYYVIKFDLGEGKVAKGRVAVFR